MNRVLKLYLVSIFWSLCAVRCLPKTSIVAIRTPTEIVIASDSLMKSTSHAPETVCKVTVLARREVFVSAQLYQYVEARFDAAELARMAYKTGRNTRQVEFAYRQLTKPRLVSALDLMREQAPQMFEHLNKRILETLFAGIDNGVPTAISTDYIPTISKDGATRD